MAQIVLNNVVAEFPVYGSQPSLRNALFGKVVGGVMRRQTDDGNRVVVRALENVSLTVNHGDQLGIIGHNGAGKSTMLRVFAGIYQPSVGDGHHRRARLAVVQHLAGARSRRHRLREHRDLRPSARHEP